MWADSWRSYDQEWLCLSSCALEKALCLGLRKHSSKSAGTQKEMGISLKASNNEETECVQQSGHLRTVL